VITLRLLAVPLVLGLLAVPPYEILLGIGRVRWTVYISAFGMITNLIFSIVLGFKIGYVGIVLGVCSAQVVLLISASFFCNHLIGVSEFTKNKWGLLRIILAAVVPVFPTIYILQLLNASGDIFRLMLAIIVYLLQYILIIIFGRALNKEDMILVRQIVPFQLRRSRKNN